MWMVFCHTLFCSISCRYIGENEDEHLNSTTRHCTCIANASPQLHIKKKIGKTKRTLVKFHFFFANRPTLPYNPKHAITVFTKNRRTTAQKCIKIRACAIITFITGHLTGCSGADLHNSLTSASSAFSA